MRSDQRYHRNHHAANPSASGGGVEVPGGEVCNDTPGKAPEKWPFEFEKVTPTQIHRWLTEADLPRSAAPSESYPAEDVYDFRPRLRPVVPVITVLDDGSQLDGEMVRMRRETLVIGRGAGDLVISNDSVISHIHAEIRRMPGRGGYQWHLVDLGSRNGTFARCSGAVLHEQAIMILGSRRFRLRNPLAARSVQPPSETTLVADGSHIPRHVWPVLEETTGGDNRMRLELRNDKHYKFVIGRLGGGADIQIDDPLLAYNHATLERQKDGSWTISTERTRNGVWVSISDVVLTKTCYFRCGETRFRFTIP